MTQKQKILQLAEEHIKYIDDLEAPLTQFEKALVENGYAAGYMQALQDVQQQQRIETIQEAYCYTEEEAKEALAEQRNDQRQLMADHMAEYVPEESDQDRRTNAWLAGYNKETELYNRDQEDRRYSEYGC